MKFIALVLALMSASAQAADVVNITVSGTLTRPPCTLSSGNALTASFGDVRTDQVAEAEPQSLNIQLSCPSGSSLTVGFSAALGTYSATVAKTSANNLGVSLLWANDNSTANLQGTLKSYSNLSGTVSLGLKAKLVQQGTLAPGQFTSALVMTINYL
ncbi:fimbrial protein [Pseudomonas sp. K1(2024)]|uniref:Fimbrial protein n=1 Tax=Pseudomonas boreofloridensis TaxID=3064348 RepID=A0ABV4ZBX0_9PSED|nr:spore coat protein U domain-containing protein [Pseudomonas sp. K13]MDO7904173.1 spore coat protein U domain-containing protein [Pseudomonas sp. K13]